MVLDIVKEHLLPSTIPCVSQLAATLRFLAEGSYQRSVGNDSTISLGRSTVSVLLSRVLKVLLKYVSPQWIKLRMDENEKRRSGNYFFNKNKVPCIVGCIDGTHIKIIKPTIDEHLYFNRKGYFSMKFEIVSKKFTERKNSLP